VDLAGAASALFKGIAGPEWEVDAEPDEDAFWGRPGLARAYSFVTLEGPETGPSLGTTPASVAADRKYGADLPGSWLHPRSAQ
jgi:hypothetical protein